MVFDEKQFGHYGVVEEVGNACNPVYGLLTTSSGIRDIRIYETEVDERGLPTKKGKQIFSHRFLNVRQAIAIKEMTGDLFPTLFIEYQTFDYMKVDLEWRDNLKSGVYSEFVVPHHTLKSFLYYLCR